MSKSYNHKKIGASQVSFVDWFLRTVVSRYGLPQKLRRLTGADADDLNQETFLQLLKHPPQSEMAMTTALGNACWFSLRILLAKQSTKKRMCKGRRLPMKLTPEPFYEQPDDLERRESVAVLIKILQNTNKPLRLIFCRRYGLFGFEEETPSQIAASLKVSPQAIDQQVGTVLRRIKDHWTMYERKLADDQRNLNSAYQSR